MSSFSSTVAKIKAKQERLDNKIQSVDTSYKSTDKYLSEKAMVEYIGEL